jgi:hypothetical protein
LSRQGGASDFTHRCSFTHDEIWTISGPHDAVAAVLKAAGININSPETQNLEEQPVETIDDMDPEP